MTDTRIKALQHRVADALALAYDGRPLIALPNEHAALHREAAAVVVAALPAEAVGRPTPRGFCKHGEEKEQGCLLAPGHDGDHLPADPPEADEAVHPPTRPFMPERAELDYPRRVIEPDGTVHAARYAPGGFTTACAVYPAPAADRIDASHAQPVTCLGCQEALDLGVVRSHGPVIPEQHAGATEPLGAALETTPAPTISRLLAALTRKETTR